MVYGRDNVELQLSVAAGLEYAGIDLDLLYTGTVELLEGSDDTGLLAGT